jgi:hypothetical protein
MTMYVRMEILIHTFLTLALYGNEWQLCPPGKVPQYPLDRRLDRPQSKSRCGDKEKNPACQESKHSCLVNILTELKQGA